MGVYGAYPCRFHSLFQVLASPRRCLRGGGGQVVVPVVLRLTQRLEWRAEARRRRLCSIARSAMCALHERGMLMASGDGSGERHRSA